MPKQPEKQFLMTVCGTRRQATGGRADAGLARGSWAEGEVERWIDDIEEWDADPKGGAFYRGGSGITRGGHAESTPESRERKAQADEALAWVREYTGTWSLILDIRSDPRWGTKYMKLSERQVEVILAAKARDAARAQVVADDPEQTAVRAFLATVTNARVGFEADMAGESGRSFSPNQLAAIERWMERAAAPASPTRPVAAPQQPVEPGMYQTPDGSIFKVQLAVHGSGRPYARRLVVDEDSKTGEFVYETGAIHRLRPEHRMSLEAAKAFGALYGMCCVCGATLTDSRSIAAGIGPVCSGRL